MPSEAHTRSGERARPGALYRLLDPAFGLFAWAIYFLIVYVGQALACSLLPNMSPDERMLVTAALVGATLVTVGIVACTAGCATAPEARATTARSSPVSPRRSTRSRRSPSPGC